MRVAFISPFLVCAIPFYHNWSIAVSSFSTSKVTRSCSCFRSTNGIEPSVHLVDTRSHNHTSRAVYVEDQDNNKSELTSRVLGFYPFPTSPPKGPLGWILRDTHQAIIVTETIPGADGTSESGNRKSKKKIVRMDFMTKDGSNHPVWYDEIVKWNVFLGGCIDGEVRVTGLGTKRQRPMTNATNEKSNRTKVIQVDGPKSNIAGSKMERLIEYADDYDCNMNLYRNNCRIFAARMEREVVRLNLEGTKDQETWRSLLIADVRCTLRIVWAAILPALYPLGAIFLLYEECFVAF